ncbi:MAG: SCO family protein [Chitinophagaceae bacterium]|nr:SCO family protein [Chitinophagaceae bacterium]
MSKKGWLYTAFFVSLALVFYAVLVYTIPGFTKRGVAPISFVRPFKFINQDGQPVTQENVKGKVFVAAYFFTTCKGICPRMNYNLKTVYEELKNEPDFLLLSHTCDPETDSVPQLKKYVDSLGVDTRKWIFLTGRKDSLYSMARLSYTIDDPANNVKSIDDDFLHTQFWALIDRNGDVRKIYDGLDDREVKKLIEDARKLLVNDANFK